MAEARRKSIIIAAGGTGGHMFPAQALAEEMLAAGWLVTLSTDPRGARFAGKFPPEVAREVVDSATFSRGGLAGRLIAPFRLLKGVAAACIGMWRRRPDVVAGFGGYPSFPAMAAAIITRRRRLIHEQNGVLGRVNRLFAAHVHRVACGTWPTDLPRGVEGVHTGNPVRASVLARAGAEYIPPGDYPNSILVIGGSQGARVLSEIVPEAVALLPEAIRRHLRVAHQARDEDRAAVARRYGEIGVLAEVETFFDDVPARLAEAQLVISRAGASSIADISVVGRPAILIPLASAIRDEQSANARGLVSADAAVLMPELGLTPGALASEVARILGDPARATAMARAARELGMPDAARNLAALVIALDAADRPEKAE